MWYVDFFLKTLTLPVNICCYVLWISVFSKVSCSFCIVFRRVKHVLFLKYKLSLTKEKESLQLLYFCSGRQIRWCPVLQYPVTWCAAHLQLIYASVGEKDVQHLSKVTSCLLVLIPLFKIQQSMQTFWILLPSLHFWSWNLWLFDLFLIFHSLIFSRCF